MKKLLFVSSLLSVSIIGCGVNLFEWADSPSSDEQKLAAARACFDEGDINCALDYYTEISEQGDVEKMERAFAILDRQGAGMDSVIAAVGPGGNGGEIITRLVNIMAPTSDAQKRVDLFAAYQVVTTINNAKLRGLLRLLTALSIVSVILGDAAGEDNILQRSDLVSDYSVCKTKTETTCLVGTGLTACAAGLANGAEVNLDGSSPGDGLAREDPDVGMIDGAISAVATALSSSELGGSGKFGGSLSSAATSITSDLDTIKTTLGVGTSDNRVGSCYRWALINQNIGADE